MACFEKLYHTDELSKRERVERTLSLQSVDRVALHEQLSYNPKVLSAVLGCEIEGFHYTWRDVAEVIRRTLDICFIPVSPRGKERVTDEDGFVSQNDEWTSWHVSRPFEDESGARDWLKRVTRRIENTPFDPDTTRSSVHAQWDEIQAAIGETVYMPFSATGFCHAYDAMGLMLFSYFIDEWPEVFELYMEVSTAREEARVEAVADPKRCPVVLIAEDFATKQGSIFSPEFLNKYHFPYIRRVAKKWHDAGVKVIYHSDGNYKKVIPSLIECGADGFYCLEPACGMDVVELSRLYPNTIWAGGLDGVDLMESQSPEAVEKAVQEQIIGTDALHRGGIFLSTSSEINPPISADNFLAMLRAAGRLHNVVL